MDIIAVVGVQEWPGQQDVSDDKTHGWGCKMSLPMCITLLPGSGPGWGSARGSHCAHGAYRYARQAQVPITHRCECLTG